MLGRTKTNNKRYPELKPYFGINKNLRNFSIWAGATVAGVASQISGTSDLRNVIPEPFDLMDHAGNLTSSMALGAGASYLAALLGTKYSNSPKIVRRVAIGIGMAAVTAANMLVETKYGLKLYNPANANPSTPDMLDMAYGVMAGAFASSLVDVVPKEEKQAETDPHPPIDTWEPRSRDVTY